VSGIIIPIGTDVINRSYRWRARMGGTEEESHNENAQQRNETLLSAAI